MLQRRAARALSQTPCAQIVQSLANLGERRGIVIVSSSWLNLVERRCSRVTSATRRQGKDASRAAILLQLLAQPLSPDGLDISGDRAVLGG